MDRLWRLQGRRTSPGQRGQSLTEFALVLPIFMLVLLMAIDFGRVFLGWVTLNNASRIAANYAASYPDAFVGVGLAAQQADYTTLVQRETSSADCTLNADGSGHNPPYPTFPDGTDLGDPAQVSLACRFGLITPFLDTILGGQSVSIGSQSFFPIRTGAIANLPGSSVPLPGAPTADFTFAPTTGTAPLTVSFTDTSTGAATWSWTFGDGGTSIQQDPTYVYAAASGTPYPVTLTVCNASACASATKSITISPTPSGPPVAGFYGTPVIGSIYVAGGGSTGSAIQGAYNLAVNFTNTSSNTGGATYAWTFGDGGTSTSANPSHTYTSAGFFTVTLVVTTSGGSNTSSITNYVTTGCQVPNFANTKGSGAASLWSAANFTGPLWYLANGDASSGSTAGATTTAPSSGSGDFQIKSQYQTGGLFLPGSSGCASYAVVGGAKS
ncbi:MAG TPA: PKD domain-containing protein [Candidatus Limnocylindrales bacterium]|nr:PKD domain-containing protein [Candidatus Limnocylindrales bacterium]